MATREMVVIQKLKDTIASVVALKDFILSIGNESQYPYGYYMLYLSCFNLSLSQHNISLTSIDYRNVMNLLQKEQQPLIEYLNESIG
mmetsp:Transcript_23461/g.26140  ORF Transcript_23461/g.26140 Transcript_23461/m.26140 type:complete len:87 (+) Transcript_23461:343-603(+)